VNNIAAIRLTWFDSANDKYYWLYLFTLIRYFDNRDF